MLAFWVGGYGSFMALEEDWGAGLEIVFFSSIPRTMGRDGVSLVR